jgi:hypothetical protein
MAKTTTGTAWHSAIAERLRNFEAAVEFSGAAARAGFDSGYLGFRIEIAPRFWL